MLSFTGAQSEESDEKYLDEWQQVLVSGFKVFMLDRIIPSESLEIICRKADIYIFISSSKSGTEQTEKY